MEQHTHTYTGGKRLRDRETETKRERGRKGGGRGREGGRGVLCNCEQQFSLRKRMGTKRAERGSQFSTRGFKKDFADFFNECLSIYGNKHGLN